MVIEAVGHPSSFMTNFLSRCGGFAVIDGGLATELERHGADLNDPLWSAKCLIGSPHLIRRVHLDYLEAGANIIISASYQATLQGFEAKGISTKEGEALLEKSVRIACDARDIYSDRATKGSWDISSDGITPKRRPILVAASIGSYGAYLADGSEYSGIYGDDIDVETLKDFHRRRVQVLAASGADLFAFETIPNKLEAKAYAELLEEEAIRIPAWFSFSCKDETNAASGDSIEDCALIADSCEQVIGVGVNCTAPRYIHGLIQSIKKVSSKPILVYPNSGETYDGERKEWVPLKNGRTGLPNLPPLTPTGSCQLGHMVLRVDCCAQVVLTKFSLLKQSTGVGDVDFVPYVGKWREAGASLIGGCCRTTPNTIKAISNSIEL